MSTSAYADKETFRDSIATVTREGRRNWLYPKKPKGKLYNRRIAFGWLLLTFLFAGPFIKIDGHPFLLLNVIERKFILFGIQFWPQDFFLIGLAMLSFIVFIILFTALFGRLWCGWACPQTIFMEIIFRKIEYLIEGDYTRQKQLDASYLTWEKAAKKIFKHTVFFSISFLIANTFLAYIIGIDELKKIVLDPPSQHITGLVSITLFTGVFYLVYARFREQVCIVACPYGRLQGVLMDKDTVVIAYDYRRGDPRGKLHKNQERSLGDCIDCHQCVQVCPTGIDIRNGTQLECINCTACIDACDDIMEKVNFPKGLIRYTSERNIAEKTKFRVTPRIKGYSVILLILLSVLVYLLASRSAVETTVLRTPGLRFQEMEKGKVSNLYTIKIVNKTFNPMQVKLSVKEPQGASIKWVGNAVESIKENSIAGSAFFILLDKNRIEKTKTPVKLEVSSGNKVIDDAETMFLGPNN